MSAPTHVHRKDTHTETHWCTLPVDMPSFVCLSAAKKWRLKREVNGVVLKEGEGRQGEEDLSALMDEVNTCCVLCHCAFERQSSLPHRETGGEGRMGGQSVEVIRLSRLLCFHGLVIIICRHTDELFHKRAVFMLIHIKVLITSIQYYFWRKHSQCRSYSWSYTRCVL